MIKKFVHRLPIAATIILCFATNAAFAEQTNITRITKDNAAQLIKTGPDAIGGIGDWHLSNGTLCAIVSSIEHEAEFAANGGGLVDLGFCDRADDHYLFGANLLDGSRKKPIENQNISIESGSNGSILVVKARAAGVELSTRYRFSSNNPTELKISKTLTRTDEGQDNFNLFTALAFNYHSLETFIFSSKNPNESKGFNNQDFVSRGTSALQVAAHNSDTLVYLSPPTAEHGIAYGWQLASAIRRSGTQETPLPYFSVADEESTAFLVLSDSFWIGDGSQIGLLQLPQIALMGLDEGDSLNLEERIFVGKSSDVASVTDQFLTSAPFISGVTENPNTAIHVDFKDGSPFTFVRSDSQGNYSFRAAPGDYVLRHVGQADAQSNTSLAVTQEAQQVVPALELPQVAQLKLPKGQAMRLVFEGLNGTPSPNFVDYLTGYNVADDDTMHPRPRVSQIYLAGIESDLDIVDIPAGEYRVYATRGIEYSLEETVIKLSVGDILPLEIDLPTHQVKTPGYIAADLHVHAGNSFDNTFSNSERVRTFVAEHGEVMVASEHDVMFDFAPLVTQMGVGDRIATVVGTELTSLLKSGSTPYTGGHVNFFPVVPRPNEYRKGVIAHEDIRLGEVIGKMRKQNPGVFSQLNHARRDLSLSGATVKNIADTIDDGAFFDHMGRAAYPYNPNRPLTTSPNNTLIERSESSQLRDIDIDAMEIINPGGKKHNERIAAVRKDWLSLLLQGERITGTANSDSHNKLEQVAVPRNMVAVQDDSIAAFSETELVQSLKAGNSYGTTGPLLNLDLSGTAMGQAHRGSSGQLNVSVSSVDWINAQTMLVFVNGKQVQELELNGNASVQIELDFDRDSFVTVEVHGTASEKYLRMYPNLAPFAFSNPVYVDYNTDGKWQPPGLESTEQLPLSPIPLTTHIKSASPVEETTSMPEHEKINYLEYQASDLNATKKFFETVFGWEFVDYGPDYTSFSNQGVDGGFERSELKSNSNNGSALTVFYSNNLSATFDKVVAAGGTINKEIFSFPGGKRFHFIEPSGNEFAVWGEQ